MPKNPEVEAQMQAALESAIKDLDETLKNAINQDTGLTIVIWLHSWYMRAGYKKLCRHLFERYHAV